MSRAIIVAAAALGKTPDRAPAQNHPANLIVQCNIFLAALHKDHYINKKYIGRLDSLETAEARTARIGDLP